MADESRCPGTVCRAAARLELMATWLPKWSVLWRRCLLPAAAKPVRLNGRLTGHRVELSRRHIHCRTRRKLARATMILRTDGSKVVLNVLCGFAPAQSSVKDRTSTRYPRCYELHINHQISTLQDRHTDRSHDRDAEHEHTDRRQDKQNAAHADPSNPNERTHRRTRTHTHTHTRPPTRRAIQRPPLTPTPASRHIPQGMRTRCGLSPRKPA